MAGEVDEMEPRIEFDNIDIDVWSELFPANLDGAAKLAALIETMG